MALGLGVGAATVLKSLGRNALTGDHRIAERDRLAHHRGAGRPCQQAAAIDLRRRLRRRLGELHLLLLLACDLFLEVLGKDLVILPRHFGLALEIALFGAQRFVRRAFRLVLDVQLRKRCVLRGLFHSWLARVRHSPVPPLSVHGSLYCTTMSFGDQDYPLSILDSSTSQWGGIGIHTGGFPEKRIRFSTTSSAMSNGLR